VIVEPMAGSTGVLIPPRGYLERLREITRKHGILLIFDEVITGFGRLGHPFASQRFGVVPDLFTTAKGLTNGTVPMGAVFLKNSLYEAFMQGPGSSSSGIELFHGYTYSGHPLACAAGIGTLETYEDESLLTRAQALEKYWEDAAHSLKGTRHVIDIRNCGLVAAIELEPRPGAPGQRAYEAFVKAFETGVLIRVTADIVALSPPLIVEKPQIDRLYQTLREVLQQVA
jgi:beta-alanine--pyruvate transaminase